MFGSIARRIFGTANDRIIKGLSKTVDQVNALEPELEALSDEELRARTDAFRERLAAGVDGGIDGAKVDGAEVGGSLRLAIGPFAMI